MWLVIRPLVAIAAGIVKILARRLRGKPDGEIGGRATCQSISKTRRGDLTGFRLGICLDPGFVFDLREESNADRFLKDLGLSQELRTGDEDFDHRIYVACDHVGLHDLLRRKPRVRAAILAVARRCSCRSRRGSAPRSPGDRPRTTSAAACKEAETQLPFRNLFRSDYVSAQPTPSTRSRSASRAFHASGSQPSSSASGTPGRFTSSCVR